MWRWLSTRWLGNKAQVTRKLIALPFRVGLGSARLALRGIGDISAWGFELAEAAAGLVRRSSSENGAPPAPEPEHRRQPEAEAPHTASRPTSRRGATPARPRPPRPRRAAPSPPQAAPPEAAPPEAAPPEVVSGEVVPEPVHTPEPEPELVLESSEPGAQDGAGAQITVAEPWEGYDRLKARAVVERLSNATPEEIATVELYETTKRARKSILEAAERRLRDETNSNDRSGDQSDG
jgi:hypothetical protein